MDKFFPELRLKGVIMTDLLPMIQLKDSEMRKEPKPYQQVFLGGKKDPLNNPENLHCYVKRLENIAPHFSIFYQYPIHKKWRTQAIIAQRSLSVKKCLPVTVEVLSLPMLGMISMASNTFRLLMN
jgi:hypothetical protein